MQPTANLKRAFPVQPIAKPKQAFQVQTTTNPKQYHKHTVEPKSQLQACKNSHIDLLKLKP